MRNMLFIFVDLKFVVTWNYWCLWKGLYLETRRLWIWRWSYSINVGLVLLFGES